MGLPATAKTADGSYGVEHAVGLHCRSDQDLSPEDESTPRAATLTSRLDGAAFVVRRFRRAREESAFIKGETHAGCKRSQLPQFLADPLPRYVSQPRSNALARWRRGLAKGPPFFFGDGLCRYPGSSSPAPHGPRWRGVGFNGRNGALVACKRRTVEKYELGESPRREPEDDHQLAPTAGQGSISDHRTRKCRHDTDGKLIRGWAGLEPTHVHRLSWTSAQELEIRRLRPQRPYRRPWKRHLPTSPANRSRSYSAPVRAPTF